MKAERTETKSSRHISLLLLRSIPGRLKSCKALPDESDETTSHFCQGHSVLFCYLCECLCPPSEVVLSNTVGSNLKKKVQEVQATILKDYLQKNLKHGVKHLYRCVATHIRGKIQKKKAACFHF